MNRGPFSPFGLRPWARAGLLVGVGLSVWWMGPELLYRLRHVLHGGQGETANWGEPLFFMIVSAIPLSAIGYAIGRAVDSFRQR